ncbi:MAG: polymer-forming cytoskeletal protein [Prolixibacteraceae bacterium]|nr:polymer-forming cytoskeletal protein [Prolixibacteraceae bacterium]MBN2649746.1 polymer-forming cytoskeletal protein [Prolixibacteraceae bacterium]
MGKQIENTSGAVNIIATNTAVTGDIKTESDIRIDGILKGNLHTNGRLILGKTGSIEGEILCETAEIEGKLHGKISVSDLLTLKSTSILTGEIATGKLMIEPGANFTGNCKMEKQTKAK